MRVENGSVVELGGGSAPFGAQDLGDVALLPGLVNAHTHFEFSDCQQPIGDAGTPLYQWIGQVIAARGVASVESKQAAIELGIRQSIAAGVRLVGEITTPPCQYLTASDCAIVSFAEVLGLATERATEKLAAAQRHFDSRKVELGWSPHAPYSTRWDTIEHCVRDSKATGRGLAMHVAESPDERELLENASGPFADSLRQIGVFQEELYPWGDDATLNLLQLLGQASRVLLVHGNDLQDAEIECLAKHSQITVVYCPRTHAFFGYDRHPVDKLLGKGVRVALGTDSRASNPDLNLWREMQFLWQHRQDLEPHEVLAMGTVAGADALGKTKFGRLAPGTRSDCGAVETKSAKIDGVFDDLATGDYRVVM